MTNKTNQQPYSVYIIAGEPSGDFIGAQLISKLKQLNPNLTVKGVGGELMEQQGIRSLFNIRHIAIMGLTEVIPKLGIILKLVKKTVEDIKKTQPDVLITIDSPGFNKKVASQIKKCCPNIKLIHYVAPSVWAYKPKRAKKFARIFDYLYCLLPFEPKYFIPLGLPAYFVGHPIVEKFVNSQNSSVVDDNHRLSDNKNLVLLPGSRVKEVTNLLPLFLIVADKLRQEGIAKRVFLPTVHYLLPLVRSICKPYPFVEISDIPDRKYQYMFQSDLALAASGTVTLELALARVKTVVAYKFNFITICVIATLIKTRFVTLINILANKEIYPELLGPKCTIKKLYTTSKKTLEQPLDKEALMSSLYKLGYGKFCPSAKAADLTLKILSGQTPKLSDPEDNLSELD